MLNTLSGSITGFELSGGEENTWAVNLMGDIAENAGTVTSPDGATGGGDPAPWNATFHGAVTPDDTDYG